MRHLLYGLKSDESLMLAYQRGDVQAFEVLYGRHKQGVFAFIYRSCPNGSCEEIAQESWMAIIDGVGRYQPLASFKTYLYQLAHHKVVDCWRRQKPPAEADGVEQLLDEHRPSAEQQYGHSQVMAAIRQLPADQRDALLLQQQGFSQQEIAAITDSGRETVKSRLRYASAALKQQFELES
jgi:RNA polymerase sigma-70 factor (ECF subfamily)